MGDRTLGAGLALLVALGLGIAAEAPDAVEDPDYRFRLERPGPGWRLLPEAEARGLLPDAVAAAASEDGVYGAVVVEHLPGTSIEELAELVLAGLPQQDLIVERREGASVWTLPGMILQATATVDDVPTRFKLVAFLRGEFAYQLLAWGLRGTTAPDGSSFDPFERAFSLLDGAVRLRMDARPTPDAVGPGWRVREGVFESLAYRFALEPPADFRLLVGEELREIDDAAEVGAALRDDSLHVLLGAENLVGVDREAVASRFLQDAAARIGVDLGEDRVEVLLGAQPFVLQASDGAQASGRELLLGVRWRGDTLFRVAAWYPPARRQQARGDLARLLRGLRFLTVKQTDALRTALDEAPLREADVGLHHSLRDGVFREFRHGIVWRRPTKRWRVAVGERASAIAEGAVLALEEPALGIFGLVVADDGSDDTLKTYHRGVVEDLWGAYSQLGKKDPESLQLDGTRALQTSGIVPVGEQRFHYTATSVVHQGTAFRILFWGYPGNAGAATAEIGWALRGFSFPGGKLVWGELAGGTFTDLRFGYVLHRPDKRWEFENRTDPSMQGRTVLVSWTRREEHILLAAVHGPPHEQTAALAKQLIGNAVGLLPAGGAAGETVLAGLPARRWSWSEPRIVDLVLARDGAVAFCLARVAPPTGERLELERVLATLERVD